MSKELMKPMSMLRYEFIQSLTNLINNSALPAFVIEAVLKDMYADIRALSQRQLEVEIKNYNAALNKDNSSDQDI